MHKSVISTTGIMLLCINTHFTKGLASQETYSYFSIQESYTMRDHSTLQDACPYRSVVKLMSGSEPQAANLRLALSSGCMHALLLPRKT